MLLQRSLFHVRSFGVTYEGLKHPIATGKDVLTGCFGVTYEGLKQYLYESLPVPLQRGFGVTYEGLKLRPHQLVHHNQTCFGVTYEGLKPIQSGGNPLVN